MGSKVGQARHEPIRFARAVALSDAHGDLPGRDGRVPSSGAEHCGRGLLRMHHARRRPGPYAPRSIRPDARLARCHPCAAGQLCTRPAARVRRCAGDLDGRVICHRLDAHRYGGGRSLPHQAHRGGARQHSVERFPDDAPLAGHRSLHARRGPDGRAGREGEPGRYRIASTLDDDSSLGPRGSSSGPGARRWPSGSVPGWASSPAWR